MVWLTEDRARLDAFRSGDPAMLAETYRAYAGEVAKILTQGFTVGVGTERHRFRGFQSPFDLDDSLQDTFVRAFSDAARQRYDGLRPFGAYLSTIARNVVIDRLRKSTTANRHFAPLDEADEAAGEWRHTVDPSPEQEVANQQLRDFCRRFKDGLEVSERRVFELRFEEQATRAVVSEATGLSSMQIRRCEERLRRRMLLSLDEAGHGIHWGSECSAIVVILCGWVVA